MVWTMKFVPVVYATDAFMMLGRSAAAYHSVIVA